MTSSSLDEEVLPVFPVSVEGVGAGVGVEGVLGLVEVLVVLEEASPPQLISIVDMINNNPIEYLFFIIFTSLNELVSFEDKSILNSFERLKK